MSSPEWFSALLADSKVTDICVNGIPFNENTASVFVDRGNGMEPYHPSDQALPPVWSEDTKRQWVLDQLSLTGRTWDARHPFVDATLPSGHRLHVAFPPLARTGILLSLRRIASATSAFQSRWAQSPGFDLLREAVTRGDSVLIAGATGSGKTTLASDLLSCVEPPERILALEDTPELCPSHPHFVSLVSRPPNADGYGEVTLRTLLKQALRMRPDRIILGECRGGEVLELLQAINTGHRGALATLHANSPRDALKRIELLCLLSAGGTIPLVAIRELISSGVQWVAQVHRVGAQRRISEVWRVEGREGDTILMRPIIYP